MRLRRTPTVASITCVVTAVLSACLASVVAADYPDPQRFSAAIDTFLAAEAESAPPHGAIVATGSSSMRGWHSRIDADLAPLTIVARGFGGSNMLDVRHFLDDLVLRHRPRAVLLYEGDNDVAVGAAPEEIAGHFDAIVAAIHANAPETRVYVLAVKPSLARWQLWPAMTATNALFKQRAANDPRITFIDVATPMLNDAGEPKADLFVADGLHMNAAGYDIWRDAVAPVLLAAEADHER